MAHPEEARMGQGPDGLRSARPPLTKVAGDKTNWKTDLSGGIQRVAIKHGCGAHTETRRPGPWSGLSRTRCRSIASRFTRHDRETGRQVSDLQGYQELPPADASTRASRRRISRRQVPDHPDLRTPWWNTKAAATSRGPIKWLAELQQEMFVEINPADGNNARDQGRTARLGQHGPGRERKHQGQGHVHRTRCDAVWRFLPFHFGGHWMQGEGPARQVSRRGPIPYVLGEAANTAHDLWLRLGDADAGVEGQSLQHQGGVREHP